MPSYNMIYLYIKLKSWFPRLDIEHTSSPRIYPIRQPFFLATVIKCYRITISMCYNHNFSHSANSRSFDIGLQIIWSGFELPVFSLTMGAFPSPPESILTTQAISQLFRGWSSFRSTVSTTRKFFLCSFHSCRDWRFVRNSFCHLD